jgi:hypothetical protein
MVIKRLMMIPKLGSLKYQLMLVCYKILFLITILYLFIFSDPNEDQFAKRITAKKERVAKNEFQRLKNIAHANKVNRK